MIVRRADLGRDVDVILNWRRERRAWLAAQGQTQWEIPIPRSAVAATVSAGQTWMVYDSDEPAATITLTAHTDPERLWFSSFDPEAVWYPEDGLTDALYASAMMVPLHRAGNGLGAELLDWAGGRAFDAGLIWLRLDAWTTNTRLHDYYRGQGFRHVRTVTSSLSGACFQRAAQPYIRGRLKTEA
jgi:GNAT superfamily N-acetyltransferase